jgi:mono/diheme cytochrome c family protein
MKMKIALVLAALALPVTAHAADAAKTWKAKCASCHGKDGNGTTTDQGKKMAVGDYTQAAWQKGIDDAAIKKAITEGVNREKNGKKQEMDGYKEKLDAETVDALVKYVRGLAK